jgi:class 3 adenylate cyclase/tetratricopeptide (TPR) repeat protein
MKCTTCQGEIPEDARFCNFCGKRLENQCRECGKVNPERSIFCFACGKKLAQNDSIEKTKFFHEFIADAELKQVTALFSDLSGYTTLTERLDPEDVREITKRIFDGVRDIVSKYEGFLERFAGDGVLAIFGVPKAHEDDPIRAVHAAREICDLLKRMSPEYETIVRAPLFMHSGINTGLAFTADVDTEKGMHCVTGEVINIAARLSDLAKAGEILVGPETYRRAAGYFTFETREPVKLKGKSELVPIYKLICPKERPTAVHSNSGFKAELIGRNAEMAQLQDGFERLKEGKTTIIAVCGDAGTGKSRLVEELKASFDLSKVRWREGNSYPFSQNIPYFPLIDLMNRAWRIEDGDPPEKIREKIESGIERLLGVKEDAAAYVGSLYSLSYPEIEEVSPEFWKARLFESIKSIVSSLTQYAPTIFCFEDIHWADPSTLDLLRFLLSEANYPVLFILVYRLPFSLFSSHQVNAFGNIYEEIRLHDLSASDTFALMQSLLRTDEIPPNLSKFIQKKAEGNPFYVEEAINALVEKRTLTHDNGKWILIRPIGETDIPPTVQGLISARLDRLEGEMKRLLQEASVIGRAFFLEVLKRITKIQNTLDRSLHGLEMLDLIRVRSVQPDLEYIFKHALTQEVAYNGLLKKDRRELHERIGLVMEQLFNDRISEFYETLAFHFKKSQSIYKAVDYLMKSGKKSVRRYAVEESHEYYKDAFELLSNKSERSKQENQLLRDLLIDWACVFYYRGDFNGLIDLFSRYEYLAESLNDKARAGMFYAWLGFAFFMNGKGQIAYEYGLRAIKLGEKSGDHRTIGYAYTLLAWSAQDLGLLEEAIRFAEKASETVKHVPTDHYLYFKPLGAIALTCLVKGDRKRCVACGTASLEYGKKHSNIRSITMGYLSMAFSHMIAGDFDSAIKCYLEAISISADPIYSQYAGCFLGAAYISAGRFQEAEEVLKEAKDFCSKYGFGAVGIYADVFSGVLDIVTKGNLDSGLERIEVAIGQSIERRKKSSQIIIEHTLGKVYLQLIEYGVPSAIEMSEVHLNNAIELSKEIRAKSILSQASLDLGFLYKLKGKSEKAKKYLTGAIKLFEECDAVVYLKKAKDALEYL